MAEAFGKALSTGQDACPGRAASAEERALDDPTGKDIEEVRRIRDEVEARVRALLAEYSIAASPSEART